MLSGYLLVQLIEPKKGGLPSKPIVYISVQWQVIYKTSGGAVVTHTRLHQFESYSIPSQGSLSNTVTFFSSCACTVQGYQIVTVQYTVDVRPRRGKLIFLKSNAIFQYLRKTHN